MKAGRDSALVRFARRGVTQPIAAPVASDDEWMFASKGAWRMALRVAKRRIEVACSGQQALERPAIASSWRRAVWFHDEAPQIGDALLDLAPRSLLAEHGIRVDLVLPRALVGVFGGDRWCRAVLASDAAIDAAAFDFAIVDSRSWNALAHKRRVAPKLPWVSVRADYIAYDFQRGQLAARRFAELLGVRLDAAAENRHARQKLEVAGEATGNAANGRVAITLGAVQPHRTYRAWPQVARALVAHGHRRLTLLGSSNGAALAQAVHDALAGTDADVLDLVGRTDIAGSRRAMASSAALVCVDGGLMHLGCTTRTPMLALFDATSLPVWRLPPDFDGATLVSATDDVNGLAADDVAAAALAFFQARAIEPGIDPTVVLGSSPAVGSARGLDHSLADEPVITPARSPIDPEVGRG